MVDLSKKNVFVSAAETFDLNFAGFPNREQILKTTKQQFHQENSYSFIIQFYLEN